jgi:hypothetical protein
VEKYRGGKSSSFLVSDPKSQDTKTNEITMKNM